MAGNCTEKCAEVVRIAAVCRQQLHHPTTLPPHYFFIIFAAILT
jgi:hypothetical protein